MFEENKTYLVLCQHPRSSRWCVVWQIWNRLTLTQKWRAGNNIGATRVEHITKHTLYTGTWHRLYTNTLHFVLVTLFILTVSRQNIHQLHRTTRHNTTRHSLQYPKYALSFLCRKKPRNSRFQTSYKNQISNVLYKTTWNRLPFAKRHTLGLLLPNNSASTAFVTSSLLHQTSVVASCWLAYLINAAHPKRMTTWQAK